VIHLSIYIEDNEFANEVKAQISLIALSHPARCDISGPMFWPSVQMAVAQGSTVASDKFFRVDYPTPAHPSDLGSQLLSKLASYQAKHIFIHGAPREFWLTLDARGNAINVSQEDGGFTIDIKNSPHVDLYIDGSPENTKYMIDSKCEGSIPERNPYVRLYHELLHAEGLIFGLAHGHWAVIPKTNDFRRQRKLGYERVLPPTDWLLRRVRTRSLAG
jgi:hypothetical protein